MRLLERVQEFVRICKVGNRRAHHTHHTHIASIPPLNCTPRAHQRAWLCTEEPRLPLEAVPQLQGCSRTPEERAELQRGFSCQDLPHRESYCPQHHPWITGKEWPPLTFLSLEDEEQAVPVQAGWGQFDLAGGGHAVGSIFTYCSP